MVKQSLGAAKSLVAQYACVLGPPHGQDGGIYGATQVGEDERGERQYTQEACDDSESEVINDKRSSPKMAQKNRSPI